MLNRRGLLAGLAAALCAPAVMAPPVLSVGATLREFKAFHGLDGARQDWTWRPIDTAPLDRPVWVYVAEYEGLPSFQTACAWHPDAGWCADELRPVTHWMPPPDWNARLI